MRVFLLVPGIAGRAGGGNFISTMSGCITAGACGTSGGDLCVCLRESARAREREGERGERDEGKEGGREGEFGRGGGEERDRERENGREGGEKRGGGGERERDLSTMSKGQEHKKKVYSQMSLTGSSGGREDSGV